MRNFADELEAGKRGEHLIDYFLRTRGNELEEAPRELQYYGVDRICIDDVGGLPYYISLEYKTDYAAERTGNLFIETQIRERDGSLSPGWLRKTCAQVLVFFIPQRRRLIFVDANDLREHIFVNGRELKQTNWVENTGGYAGKGMLMPLTQVRQLRSCIELDMDDGRRI